MTRYTWETEVINVYERTEVKARSTGERDAKTGLTIYEKTTVHTGEWFVRVSASSAIYVGSKPDLKRGDRVRLTMEKAT